MEKIFINPDKNIIIKNKKDINKNSLSVCWILKKFEVLLNKSTSRILSGLLTKDIKGTIIPIVINSNNEFIKRTNDIKINFLFVRLLKYEINIVNDISSLEDKGLLDIVKSNRLSISLMHMLGTPKTMQINPIYDNVVDDIYGYLKNRAELCINHGIDKSNIIIDPGFGFGKTLDHNYEILNNLEKFSKMGYRVLSGISRKSMIGDVLNKPVTDRLYGSLAASVIAIKNNTSILRVHDVRETKMLLNFKELITNS